VRNLAFNFSSTACWDPDRFEGTEMTCSGFSEEQIIGVLQEQEVRLRSSAVHAFEIA
jgi:hypothetical protein